MKQAVCLFRSHVQFPGANEVHFPVQVPRCKKWMKEACLDVFDEINCSAALSFCSSQLSGPFSETGTSPHNPCLKTSVDDASCAGLSPYDISRPCDGDIEDTLCFPITKYVPISPIHPYLQSSLNRVPQSNSCIPQPACRPRSTRRRPLPLQPQLYILQ